MAEPPFVPARLRLARELSGWSQIELARRAGLTSAALSQFESGVGRPAMATGRRLGDALGVAPAFFELPLVDTHDGFFRSLRRTPVAERRRARAIAHIAHDLAVCGHSQLPERDVPAGHDAAPSDSFDVIERIAAQIRATWGIARGPIPDVVGVIESHGIVVMRLPLESSDVDAFSLPFPDRPIIILGADKNDRARSRFDAAHELGHIVMHGEQVWGLPEVEPQAHRFAAAFLMPKRDIYDELPTDVDWARFFSLKKKWQVSLGSLLMRARTLGRLTDGNYLTAIKAASARGWRRIEPIPLGRPEQPKLLRGLLHSSIRGDCGRLLPKQVVGALDLAVTA
jgi:Zn-dependent peptidase ImmA (M78 family)/transcriptional regulator with XRE-family HTH domain